MFHAQDMQMPESAPRAETSHWILPGGSVQGGRSAGESFIPCSAPAERPLGQGRGPTGECRIPRLEEQGLRGLN